MGVVSIILVIAFAVILCVVEIPKMREKKEYKELVAFSIILFCGTLLTVLKSLNVEIPNPADFIAAVYSPVVNLIKGALE